jgi:tryptophan synthase alpha chain
MSRIQQTFDALQSKKKKALITFITAGDPAPELTVPLMHAMVDSGVDILELGVPFSDPMAEGPVIQRANERALKFNVGMRDVLEYVRVFRRDDPNTPVVLMGYANPIERLGIDRFVSEAKAAGVDGAIVVDYPPEEAQEFADKLRAQDMDLIFLLAPTSTEARIKQVAQISSGFSYYVSLRGVTGAGHIDTTEVSERISAIRQHVKLPIGVGFGIRDAATASAVARAADAVIIGTRMIQLLEDGPAEGAPGRVGAFISEVRAAIDERPRE